MIPTPTSQYVVVSVSDKTALFESIPQRDFQHVRAWAYSQYRLAKGERVWGRFDFDPTLTTVLRRLPTFTKCD